MQILVCNNSSALWKTVTTSIYAALAPGSESSTTLEFWLTGLQDKSTNYIDPNMTYTKMHPLPCLQRRYASHIATVHD